MFIYVCIWGLGVWEFGILCFVSRASFISICTFVACIVGNSKRTCLFNVSSCLALEMRNTIWTVCLLVLWRSWLIRSLYFPATIDTRTKAPSFSCPMHVVCISILPSTGASMHIDFSCDAILTLIRGQGEVSRQHMISGSRDGNWAQRILHGQEGNISKFCTWKCSLVSCHLRHEAKLLHTRLFRALGEFPPVETRIVFECFVHCCAKVFTLVHE
jgi:hypothetical protein